MGSDTIVNAFGMLHLVEIAVAMADSKVPEIDAALRETEKHLQAAEASLRIALIYRQTEEK